MSYTLAAQTLLVLVVLVVEDMVLVGEDANVVALVVEGIRARLKEEGNCNGKKQGDRHCEDRKRPHWCLKIRKQSPYVSDQ